MWTGLSFQGQVYTFAYMYLPCALIHSDLQMKLIEASPFNSKNNNMQILWQVSVSLAQSTNKTQFNKNNQIYRELKQKTVPVLED